MTEITCPRCGHTDTFIKGFLPGTCACRICQSQLSWREIPGMGPDCKPLPATEEAPKQDTDETGAAAEAPRSGGEQGQA